MAIYLEMPQLADDFPFRILLNDGNILTTPHWHREIEIIYVTEGTINLGINDRPYTLRAGELVLINGGDIHYVLPSPGSERIVFQFDLAFFVKLDTDNVNLQEVFHHVEPFSPLWGKEQEATIRALLEECYQEEQRKSIGYQFQIKGKLLVLLVHILRELPKKSVTQKSQLTMQNQDILEKLDKIFCYVEDHYKQKIMLSEVASLVGYSDFYFTKFFKKNTGKTFITFLNDYRIDKAKWLLINSTANVSEIISQIGIENDKTFYRWFRHSMGMSPLMYRKKMITKDNNEQNPH
ncbi:helix-turn-helix transcriptional regulator [Vagococcus sp. BWB3-3]|uniref:Helix-turn-helix transcriptional regulator n=1 Tax=Vagococcus allomyrinae TaxID=2794353 RepID=A0A940PC09_9ENTE|nr:AraC family transcriptional regulator [Vagococcus allomyrinae]MBP1042204.1 helix-turn-helix transcriptional regulator [Vagococcus allomyrinae]